MVTKSVPAAKTNENHMKATPQMAEKTQHMMEATKGPTAKVLKGRTAKGMKEKTVKEIAAKKKTAKEMATKEKTAKPTKEPFMWTDDEMELQLKVALE